MGYTTEMMCNVFSLLSGPLRPWVLVFEMGTRGKYLSRCMWLTWSLPVYGEFTCNVSLSRMLSFRSAWVILLEILRIRIHNTWISSWLEAVSLSIFWKLPNASKCQLTPPESHITYGCNSLAQVLNNPSGAFFWPCRVFQDVIAYQADERNSYFTSMFFEEF